MTHPRWHPWVADPSPPLAFSSSACASPLILDAPANWPVEKLWVGYPPASLMTLVNTLVPYAGRPSPVTGCFLKPATNALLASLNFSGSAGSRLEVPSSSTTITLRPLDPMTAPTPPRPACRVGRCSISVKAMDAADIFISPAGPMLMQATLSPYSVFIFSTRS